MPQITFERANTEEFGVSMKVVDADIKVAKGSLNKPKKAVRTKDWYQQFTIDIFPWKMIFLVFEVLWFSWS